MNDEHKHQDLMALIQAMTTAGQYGATYQLPEPVALRYAQLVREQAQAPLLALLRETAALLGRMELDDFGRWQLDRAYVGELEPLLNDITALLNATPQPMCPPCHGDCNQGRDCPKRSGT